MDNFSSVCGNFMHGACVLLNLIGNLLYTKKWSCTDINDELLPDEMPVVYKHATETIARDDALPIITYSVGPTVLENNLPAINAGGAGSSTVRSSTAIKFTISTINVGLTAAIAAEIGAMCMAAAKSLRRYGLMVNRVTIGEVQPSSHNCFVTNVDIQCGLGYSVWNLEEIEDKLREIGTSLDFV